MPPHKRCSKWKEFRKSNGSLLLSGWMVLFVRFASFLLNSFWHSSKTIDENLKSTSSPSPPPAPQTHIDALYAISTWLMYVLMRLFNQLLFYRSIPSAKTGGHWMSTIFTSYSSTVWYHPLFGICTRLCSSCATTSALKFIEWVFIDFTQFPWFLIIY